MYPATVHHRPRSWRGGGADIIRPVSNAEIVHWAKRTLPPPNGLCNDFLVHTWKIEWPPWTPFWRESILLKPMLVELLNTFEPVVIMLLQSFIWKRRKRASSRIAMRRCLSGNSINYCCPMPCIINASIWTVSDNAGRSSIFQDVYCRIPI